MKTVKLSFKNSIAFLLWIIIASGPSYGFEKTFTFDLSDFTLNNQDGTINILPNNRSYSFDYNQPGFPNIPFFQFVIPTNNPCDISTLRYEVISTRKIATNVRVQLNEPYVIMGRDVQEQEEIMEAEYGLYPDSLIRLYNGPALFDNRIVLAISPFVYDKTNKILSFANKIQVSFNELPAREKTFGLSNDRSGEGQFDYLIITQDSLKETFEKLRDWKTTKGVKTKIVTLDYIASLYDVNPPQNVNAFHIKKYIRYCYNYCSIKMVLLGGTYPLVPAQECRIYFNGDLSVLSDMYYACLYDDWTWDFNQNGIIGELTGDGVNLTPTISVSRLPIETNAQLSSYIQKLLLYEKNPRRNGYLSNMLLSGKFAHNYYPNGKSDAQFESELMYNNIHNFYPSLIGHHFYDTWNDLNRHGTDSIVNAVNLSAIIEDFRPHWFNMYSHGSTTRWANSEINPTFTVDDAAALENDSTPMVITTPACHTANFSQSYPCLAESFLRHPSGGAIAYWGSSHYGIGSLHALDQLSPSMVMCAEFWDSISSNCHFGDAVKCAKKSCLPLANYQNGYNLLLKSMNALGDCELPIYSKEPSEFTNIFIRVLWDAVYVKPDSFSVAVTSKGDNGDSFFFVDTLAEVYGASDPIIPVPCNICFTKKNYVPFVTETGHFVGSNDYYELYLQDISYKGNEVYYEADRIYIGNQVDTSVENGDVIVESGAKLSTYAFERNIIPSGFRCKLGGQVKIGIEVDYTELQ